MIDQEPSSAQDELPYGQAIDYTAQIVSAFVSNNSLQPSQLPELISSVRSALGEKGAEPITGSVTMPTAAEIKRSITPAALISFIDGRPYKTLKRHLGKHDLTPEAYRKRYGLPSDYPMVCANYSAARSELAQSLGLGQIRKKPAA